MMLVFPCAATRKLLTTMMELLEEQMEPEGARVLWHPGLGWKVGLGSPCAVVCHAASDSAPLCWYKCHALVVPRMDGGMHALAPCFGSKEVATARPPCCADPPPKQRRCTQAPLNDTGHKSDAGAAGAAGGSSEPGHAVATDPAAAATVVGAAAENRAGDGGTAAAGTPRSPRAEDGVAGAGQQPSQRRAATTPDPLAEQLRALQAGGALHGPPLGLGGAPAPGTLGQQLHTRQPGGALHGLPLGVSWLPTVALSMGGLAGGMPSGGAQLVALPNGLPGLQFGGMQVLQATQLGGVQALQLQSSLLSLGAPGPPTTQL